MRKDPGLASTHKHLCTCTHKHRHILSLKGSCYSTICKSLYPKQHAAPAQPANCSTHRDTQAEQEECSYSDSIHQAPSWTPLIYPHPQTSTSTVDAFKLYFTTAAPNHLPAICLSVVCTLRYVVWIIRSAIWKLFVPSIATLSTMSNPNGNEKIRVLN